MTTVGRGRGWGSNQDKVPLRRPGETVIPADIEMEALVAAIQSINLQEPAESVAMLRSVEELLKSSCQTEDNLRLIVQRLHDRSLEDRQFGMKAAAAYGSVASLEVGGVKLRNVLLLAVQKDFEDRALLQTSCTSKFLNAIALLGEIFHCVRLPDGSPINVLAGAVLQYQDMLLGGEEHELELFTTQLAVNGRKLYDCQAAKLEELMLRVRTTLMSRNLSGQCRCWLLLSLDLAANRYAPLSGQLQSFYQMHLGANAVQQLQRLQLCLKVDTTTSTHASEPVGVSDGHGILKCRTTENGMLPVSSPSGKAGRIGTSDSKPGSGRGGGVGRKPDKKGWGNRRQDGDQNDDIWGSSRGEKAEPWGHDDRFVKDDDFYGKQAHRGEGSTRPRMKDKKGAPRPQQSVDKNEVVKAEPPPDAAVNVAPPPLPEEESWD